MWDQYEVNGVFDEMFAEPGVPQPKGDHADVIVLTHLPKDDKEEAKRTDGKPFELKRNVTIEQVRAMQQRLHTRPTLGARRAVIIDPADDLERPAQSALLKSLEEPPRGPISSSSRIGWPAAADDPLALAGCCSFPQFRLERSTRSCAARRRRPTRRCARRRSRRRRLAGSGARIRRARPREIHGCMVRSPTMAIPTSRGAAGSPSDRGAARPPASARRGRPRPRGGRGTDGSTPRGPFRAHQTTPSWSDSPRRRRPTISIGLW